MAAAPPQLAAYAPPLDGLDAATLAPVVRRALRRPDAVPVSWRWRPLSYDAYYPRRTLVQVDGEASLRSAGAETVAWRAVLKIIAPPAPARSAASGAMWDREVRAYRSGLLRRLPDGFAAPRVLHVATDAPDAGGAVWLWLEHVQDAFGGRWPLAQYGVAARHLGRFNGAYGAHEGARPQPRYRWLNRQWAESHCQPARLPDARQEVDELLAHPDVRAVFPGAAGDRLRRLLDDQAYFLELLAGLARTAPTLCHHDASSANLFARRSTRTEPADGRKGGGGRGGGEGGDERDGCTAWETVAIDWEEIGSGPIGAEAATLVFGTMRRGAFPVHRAGELEQTVLEQYLCGLRDAGWRGDPETVRLGYAAAVALRWFVMPAALRLVADPAARAAAARAAHETAEALVQRRLLLLQFLLDRADEARRLARRHYHDTHAARHPCGAQTR